MDVRKYCLEKSNSVYRFLPVQLLLLHFRKYQLLLLFWIIITSTVTGNFAKSFGARTLFLAPEYLGEINFVSMLLLGAAMAAFVMSWHITTFIIHSKRMPFIGAARQSFLKYCINNSIIPLAFLIFYSAMSVRFQYSEERASVAAVIIRQGGFYLGFFIGILLAFAYFFRAGRDLLKTVLAKITNPAILKELIPYDEIDFEFAMITADTYLTENLKVEHIGVLEKYHPRVLNTILRRHHRNAIAATFFSLLLLLVLGAFMERPALRIPAGAGFLILFSVMMGIVGAVKYFLRSWEMIGWVMFFALLSLMVKVGVFDLRSIAYGINYKQPAAQQPVYDYEALKSVFTPDRYEADKQTGLSRLEAWRGLRDSLDGGGQHPLVVVSISGGGSRSAYWTFRCLQYLDSATGGRLYDNCVLMTGASGGMIGGSYWRSLHAAAKGGRIADVYSPRYQENMGKDLLNAIVFSLASVDLISPFNKISVGDYSYTKDRGYAMEQELVRNSDSLLDRRIGDFSGPEARGEMPAVILNSTIINDGRRLMVSAQPASYLCQPAYTLRSVANPPIDAVDFATFFAGQDPYKLRLTTALRMNATFPLVLPVVKLPSRPQINVMDAGLRDNFGLEIASRFLFVYRDWLLQHSREVIWLEIRDTREYEVFPPTSQDNFGGMLADPVSIIQHKWEPFQSYYQGYVKDYAPAFLPGKLHFVSLQYTPEKGKKTAALNFHLTQVEKAALYNAIRYPANQQAADTLVRLLRR